MITPPDGSAFTADFVKAHLVSAGTTLLCLPHTGTRPAGFRTAWPEVAHNFWEAYQDDLSDRPMRFPRASSGAISAMDYVFRVWVPLVGTPHAVQTRRIILLRSLMNPLTERHMWSWRRLQERTGLNRDTLAIWHGRGIDRIVTRLNRPEWVETIARRLP